MKRRLVIAAWVLLVLAFAGATACAGSCTGHRPQPQRQEPAP